MRYCKPVCAADPGRCPRYTPAGSMPINGGRRADRGLDCQSDAGFGSLRVQLGCGQRPAWPPALSGKLLCLTAEVGFCAAMLHGCQVEGFQVWQLSVCGQHAARLSAPWACIQMPPLTQRGIWCRQCRAAARLSPAHAPRRARRSRLSACVGASLASAQQCLHLVLHSVAEEANDASTLPM